MSKFEQFFASNKVMITSLVISLIAFAMMIVIDSLSIAEDLQFIFDVAFDVIMFFIVLAMYRSFAKHETNAMNIVTGAAIAFLLLYYVQRFVANTLGAGSLFDIITLAITVVVYAILLVNHVQINSIHRSTRGRIILNQVILIVIAVYQIFLIISYIVLIGSTPEMMLELIFVIACSLAELFISLMIICIETKLNAYKIDRGLAQAEGTWTDEKKAEAKEKHFGK